MSSVFNWAHFQFGNNPFIVEVKDVLIETVDELINRLKTYVFEE